MGSRLLIGVLALVAVVLAVGIVLYLFGGPQGAGDVVAGGNAGVAVTATAAELQAPPPDPSSPLAIELPGCVCHSDDPAVVAEHAQYRMNQCFGCHADGMPQMGQ